MRQTLNILSQLELLASCSLPLACACKKALGTIDDWFRLVDKKQRPNLEEDTSRLQSALDDYRTARLETVKPFRHLFDPSHTAPDEPDPRFVSLPWIRLTVGAPACHFSELRCAISPNGICRSTLKAVSQAGGAAPR